MSVPRVIVVGGGFSGCAAALAAAKVGAEVTLLERTDMLLAGGNRAGRVNHNGKLIVAEECKELGGGELFQALESITLHHGTLPGEHHGYVYNTALAEAIVRKLVEAMGINLQMESRAIDVRKRGDVIRAVRLANREEIDGDVFIDSTGSSGGRLICNRYGLGCVMCYGYRCHVFGDRVSIATRAGALELRQQRPDGTPGLVSASIQINKASLELGLRNRIEKEGVTRIPLPQDMIDYSKQYKISNVATREEMEYLNLVDIGSVVKTVKAGYLSLSKLRSLPGLEMAQIEDPMGGGKFGFIKSVSMTPRDNSLKVKGLANMFVAGEKAGPIGGIDEVIATGIIAGSNAARLAAGQKPLILPTDTATGDFIAFTGEHLETPEGLHQGYRLAGGSYFERMKTLGIYNPDPAITRDRIKKMGLSQVLAKAVT